MLGLLDDISPAISTAGASARLRWGVAGEACMARRERRGGGGGGGPVVPVSHPAADGASAAEVLENETTAFFDHETV
jgi:hypothetical protein